MDLTTMTPPQVEQQSRTCHDRHCFMHFDWTLKRDNNSCIVG